MSKRVLVVDDDERCRRLVQDVLAHRGHTVVALASGEAALAYVDGNEAPDLVLLDIQLGVLSGVDVLTHIRASERWRRATVLAITASVMPSQRGQLASAGFDAVIAKPFESLKVLVQAVESAPATHQPSHE